jgi:HTH-type transcriptional regulator / antitoxin HipB
VELREKAGLTQAQLADRAGVRQPLISRLESGKLVNTELRTLVKLAAALGVRARLVFEPVRKAKAGKKTRVA